MFGKTRSYFVKYRFTTGDKKRGRMWVTVVLPRRYDANDVKIAIKRKIYQLYQRDVIINDIRMI